MKKDCQRKFNVLQEFSGKVNSCVKRHVLCLFSGEIQANLSELSAIFAE